MTREEAIEVIKLALAQVEWDYPMDYAVAFDMAIKALEQEPTTKNDLADDKTFYEQMVEYCNEHFLVLVEKDVWEDARKALTTKNDLAVDCISRAEAIKCLECDFDITGKENMKTVVNYINSAHDKIVNLPRVKQEPKTGHWKDIPEYTDIAWECSECGRFTTLKHNYCPMCGARMVEPQESEG